MTIARSDMTRPVKLARIALTASVAAALTGCPAVFYGQIRNESSAPIYIINDQNHVSEPAATGETTTSNVWPGYCVRLVAVERTRYFDLTDWAAVPEDVYGPRFASTDIYMAYSDEGLFFESESEGRIPATEIERCDVE